MLALAGCCNFSEFLHVGQGQSARGRAYLCENPIMTQILFARKLFVPAPDSKAVKRLGRKLRAEKLPVRVRVITEPHDKEKDCYGNVRNKLEREGGKMQLGWAIWQHEDLFIEAERHAVFDPGDGKPWVDCTPHILPDGMRFQEILFVPDDSASYDFSTTIAQDNVRMPLINDPRVSEALRLLSEKTALMNTVPGINIELPPDVIAKMSALDVRISKLLSDEMEPAPVRSQKEKIGRNDPCPCGSGKKYKKCHGR